nr:hypothetical protein [Tanacetum cinerariifolium]GFA31973.1 hypothetical protein [Tanacetum cinerariifolium]
EDLGKLKPKADISIFIGYSLAKKSYWIYNKQARLIMETIHVKFYELTAMNSKQFSSGLELQLMTHGSINSRLMQNLFSSTPYVPPSKKDWDILFQPIFDEYFQPSPNIVSSVPHTLAPILTDTSGKPSSTLIDQNAPYASTSPTTPETKSLVSHLGVEEQIHETKNAQFHNDPFQNIFTLEPSSKESSSRDVIPSNLHPTNLPFEHLNKWKRTTRWTMLLAILVDLSQQDAKYKPMPCGAILMLSSLQSNQRTTQKH